MPEAWLNDFGPAEPEAAGRALKDALSAANISTSDVAIGLPGRSYVVRPLGVPPVSEYEAHQIVQGEIEHLQLFREVGASFDLVRLQDANLLESAGRNTLVLGAERRTLDAFEEMAEAAGLRVAAIEPLSTALFRVAYAQAGSVPNLVVTLVGSHAEIFLLDRGQIALHRSFDLGGAPIHIPVDENDGEMRFDPDAASTLAVEMRRSIDFIARELPEAPATEAVHFATNQPQAHHLASWLAGALRVEVVLASVVGAESILWEDGQALPEDDALRVTGAFGVALRDTSLFPKDVPLVDLFAHEHIQAGVHEKGRRRFQMALAAVAFLFVLGSALAAVNTVRANNAAEDLARSMKRLDETRKLEQAQAKEETMRQDRLRLLTMEGVPLTGLMPTIVRSLPPNTGLSELRLNGNLAEIAGEALDEGSVIRMTDALRASPRFNGISLTWFERVNPTSGGIGMRFRLSAFTQTAPAAPVAAPAPPASVASGAGTDNVAPGTAPEKGRSTKHENGAVAGDAHNHSHGGQS